MATFERSVIIRTPMPLVYNFFHYTPNVRLLMPFPFKMLDSKMPPVPEVGASAGMDIRAWGMRQRWVLKWKELRAPGKDALPETEHAPAVPASSASGTDLTLARITMQAEYSPFLFYVHTLTLRELASDGPTELHDRIDYEPRPGIASWATRKLVLGEFDRLYTFRQGRAKRILELAHRPLSMAKRDEESKEQLHAVKTASENEVRFGDGSSQAPKA